MLEDEEDNIRKITEEGMKDDELFEEEYDDMNRELKNFHPYHGKYKPHGGDEEAITLGQINVRELTEDRLIFRRIPFIIWTAGLVV